MLGLFQNLGPTELLIILAVVLLLFGATRIPALARSLGKSVHEFKKGLKEDSEADTTKQDTSKPESEPEEKK